MIRVSDATKQAFLSDVSKKSIRVVFPELNLIYDAIEAESLKLTEAISTKDSVEYVGCIASCLELSIYGIDDNIKNKRIEVYIKADDTDEIPLFKGIVDSAVINADSLFKKITAYDVLYKLGDTDVVGWYNQQLPTAESKKTVKELRDSLCNYLGIGQVNIDLPNDATEIKRQYDPKSLKCITVLKSICQLNGCCGIINREGLFDYRYILPVIVGTFPGRTTFPGLDKVPGTGNVANVFTFFGSMKYEEYYVKQMQRVQIRDSEDDSGITVGASSGNKYIVQSNMLTKNLLPSQLKVCAENILEKLKIVKFHPFTSKNYGMPFVEVGDTVRFQISEQRTGTFAVDSFTVLSRTLTGVQILNDTYDAKGNEEQSEFVTDLQVTLETLKMNGGSGGGGDLSDYWTKEQVQDYVGDYAYSKDVTADVVSDQVAEQVTQMETPTGFTVVSCYTLPTNRQANTIYLVQSDIVVVR